MSADPITEKLNEVAESIGAVALRGLWLPSTRPSRVKGAIADEAVDWVVEFINRERLAMPNLLNRTVFVFPRVRTSSEDESGWKDPTMVAAPVASIARNPSSSVTQPAPLREWNREHPIPSVSVWLNGITDVEYHVSRRNFERLLQVGCITIRPSRRRFEMRIPWGNPLLTQQPFEFEGRN